MEDLIQFWHHTSSVLEKLHCTKMYCQNWPFLCLLPCSLFPGLIFQLTDSALAVIDVVVMSLTRLVRNDSDDGDVLCSCKQGKGQVPKPVTAPSSNAAMTTNKVFEGIGDDDL